MIKALGFRTQSEVLKKRKERVSIMSNQKKRTGFGGRQILLLGLVALVITAGYYRWTVEKENFGAAVSVAGDTVPTEENGNAEEKNKEDNQNKDDDGKKSSEQMTKLRQERDSARSASVEEWTKLTKDSATSAESRKAAEDKVKNATEATEKEKNIEMQVKAKGYEDCFAYISESGVSVTVCGGETDGAKVAQIKDIIVTETNVPVKNIKINSL